MKSMRLFFPVFVALGLMVSTMEAVPVAIGSPTPMPNPKFLGGIPKAVIATNNTVGITINLTKHFKAAPAPSDQVFVTTSSGNFYMQLFPSNAPATVANFLSYVNDSAYENMFIHRSVPGFIIQTGGYTLDSYLDPIATFPPIASEAGLSNVRGTVAMALSPGDPNSATSQWFINETNNTYLDTVNNGNGPYTVFAQVIGNGMAIVDALGAVPAYDLSSLPFFGSNTPFTSVPLQNFDGTDVYLDSFVGISHVITLPYFAASSDPTAFSTEIQGTNLIVKFLSYGKSDVTITAYATDTNGNSIRTSFAVAPTPKGSQTITFPSQPAQIYSTNAYTFNNYTNYPSSSSGIEPSTSIKSGPAKIVNQNFYFTGAGTVTLVAHQSGNANYNAAAPVTNTVIVNKAAQTITPFPSIASTNVTKFPYSFTLPNLPTASSGLPVKILISGPAKISGKKITVSATQQVTLTAGQAGNALYNPAPIQTTNFTISQTVIPTGATIDLGGGTLTNLGSMAGGVIQNGTITNSGAYTLQGGTISATIEGTGGLTMNGTGTVTLSGTNTYTGGTTISNGTLLISNGNGLLGLTTIGFSGTLLLGAGLPGQQFAFTTNGLISLSTQALSLVGLSTNADYSNVTNTDTNGRITLTNGGIIDFNFGSSPNLTTTNGAFSYTNGLWSAGSGTYSFTGGIWNYTPASY